VVRHACLGGSRPGSREIFQAALTLTSHGECIGEKGSGADRPEMQVVLRRCREPALERRDRCIHLTASAEHGAEKHVGGRETRGVMNIGHHAQSVFRRNERLRKVARRRERVRAPGPQAHVDRNREAGLATVSTHALEQLDTRAELPHGLGDASEIARGMPEDEAGVAPRS
jgi:hypothetical protein